MLILLPGNSKNGKKWLEDAENEFSSTSQKIYSQEYDHWETDEDIIDIDMEFSKLKSALKNNSEEKFVIAKSAGSLLALRLAKIDPTIKKVVFLGFPVSWAEENNLDIDGFSEGYTTPTLIIQNDNDPVTDAATAKEWIDRKKMKNIKLVAIPGDNHSYSNFADFRKEIDNFLKL